MATGRTSEVRVPAKQTVTIAGIDITNRTANAITVRKTSKGLAVTNCCLEEQGL